MGRRERPPGSPRSYDPLLPSLGRAHTPRSAAKLRGLPQLRLLHLLVLRPDPALGERQGFQDGPKGDPICGLVDDAVGLGTIGMLTAVVPNRHPRFVGSDPLDLKRRDKDGRMACRPLDCTGSPCFAFTSVTSAGIRQARYATSLKLEGARVYREADDG